MKELNHLKAIEKELHLLAGVTSLLHWDRSTIIPKKAISQRAEQLAYFSKIIHQKLTSPELKKTVEHLNNRRQQLSKIEACIVRHYFKDLKKIEKIPVEHVEKFSLLSTLSSAVWEKAREQKDFSLFAPYLKKVLQMKQQEAKLIDPQKNPYNVLLDDFEEGMNYKKMDSLFRRLKPGLLEILQNIQNSARYRQQVDLFEKKDFPVDKQKEITRDLKQMILQDNERNTNAESVHPFTTRISEDDVRLTTAYRTGQPLFSFTSTAHEAGHALYELGFDKNISGTILGDAPSLGLHESQARFWENQVTKSREFWKFYYPKYQKAFPALKQIFFADFYFLINQVKPSLVRIECDEVTYCLHIIIRYELEKALVEGKLKVQDLPAAWNEKYCKYLNVTPRNDTEGVLQDMHWSEGLFGYFPTYVLGNIYSAMIFKRLQKEHPLIKKELAKGNFSTIIRWLKQKIHRHGSTLLAEEIIQKVCRKKVTPDDFLEYLKEKYYPLYGVKTDGKKET